MKLIIGLIALALLLTGCAQQECNGLSLEEAKVLAQDCEGNLLDEAFCNENTATWWIETDLEKEGCNPACVVSVETKEAVINWRCTGVIIE